MMIEAKLLNMIQQLDIIKSTTCDYLFFEGLFKKYFKKIKIFFNNNDYARY